MKATVITRLAIGAISLAMSACNQEELARSRSEIDSLRTEINERTSTINDFITSFSEVEASLDSITSKQNIIYLNADRTHGGEFSTGSKDRINAEIETINHMMEQNRNTIAALTNKLKRSTNKNVKFEKMIAMLTDQLKEKDLELNNLNKELNLRNFQVAQLKTWVDTLTAVNTGQAQTILKKDAELHTAYYIVGRSKELEDAQLIDKQGGLLGIGRTAKLSATFDNSKFIRIDYTETYKIYINSKTMKIITSHPAGSYTLNKDANDDKLVKNLVIIDPEKFWSASKYLVIVNG